MTATVISPTGAHNVLVRDISREGAQICADRTIFTGQDVCFKRGRIFVAARVAWRRKGTAGLRFYRELSTAERDTAFHTVIVDELDQPC